MKIFEGCKPKAIEAPRKTPAHLITFCLCLLFIIPAYAQDWLQTSSQIYQEIRATESAISLEIDSKIRKGEMPTVFGTPGSNQDKLMKLNAALEQRAAAGDPDSMFYVAMLKTDLGKKIANHEPQSEANSRWAEKEFLTALDYFKKAGNAGISAGCWNAALMYANGEGGTQSNLAAAEWFYKAGVSYLKDGNREHALASLEAIEKVSKNHDLAKRLAAALRKSAPK